WNGDLGVIGARSAFLLGGDVLLEDEWSARRPGVIHFGQMWIGGVWLIGNPPFGKGFVTFRPGHTERIAQPVACAEGAAVGAEGFPWKLKRSWPAVRLQRRVVARADGAFGLLRKRHNNLLLPLFPYLSPMKKRRATQVGGRSPDRVMPFPATIVASAR